MLPIIIFEDDRDFSISDNTISIVKFKYSCLRWLTLYLRVGELNIDQSFEYNELADELFCFDGTGATVVILFGRELNIQELAEELSQKFEYNADRIRAAMANIGNIRTDTASIELAFVPRSKRAV